MRDSSFATTTAVIPPAGARLTPVALVAPHHLAHCRRILRGVAEVAARHRWSLLVVPPGPGAVRAVVDGQAQGIIAHLADPRLERALTALHLPLVEVSGLLPASAIPRVGIDDRLVGHAAASHLLDTGHRTCAFLGHARHAAARQREAGWRAALAGRGFPIHVHQQSADARAATPTDQPLPPATVRWLLALPPGTALACWNDLTARQAVEHLIRAGRTIPQQLAVVGVDDDDLLCTIANPALSSVAVPSRAIGLRAANLLATLLAGSPAPRQPVLLPPLGVVARRSSDRLAEIDPAVASALDFIRDHLGEPLSVARLASIANCERRTLERRFQQDLGRGIAGEIRQQRLMVAKHRLAERPDPVSDIAWHCGFGDAKRLCTVFRRMTGMTPLEWRDLARE